MKALVLNAIFLSIVEFSPVDAFVDNVRVPTGQQHQQHRRAPRTPATAMIPAASPKCHGLVVLRESPTTGSETADSRGGQEEDLFLGEADSIFDAIDADADGEISNDDLRGYLEKRGYPSESLRSLFAALDKNADGIITRDEMRFAFSNYEISALYKAFGLGNRMAPSDDDVVAHDDAVSKLRSNAIADADNYSPELLTKLADIIFDMIDTDESGEIDAEELRMHFADKDTDENFTSTAFRQVGQASMESVESILKALDINSDGVISREEMREGFKNYDPRALSSALGLQVSRTAEV